MLKTNLMFIPMSVFSNVFLFTFPGFSAFATTTTALLFSRQAYRVWRTQALIASSVRSFSIRFLNGEVRKCSIVCARIAFSRCRAKRWSQLRSAELRRSEIFPKYSNESANYSRPEINLTDSDSQILIIPRPVAEVMK